MLVNIRGDDKARNKTIDIRHLMRSKNVATEEFSTVTHNFILIHNAENC